MHFTVLSLFLLSPALGHAGMDTPFVKLQELNSYDRILLNIPSVEDCEKQIKGLFSPEGKIIAGLAAVDSIQSPLEANVSCLEEGLSSLPEVPLIDANKKGIKTEDFFNTAYAKRRLLTLYTAFRKNGGSDLHAFCLTYKEGIEKIHYFRDVGLSTEPYIKAKQWELARKYGFTETDLYALKIYTLEDFTRINPQLRAGEPLEPAYQAVKDAMDPILKRLPSYTETSVARVAYLPPDIAKKYAKDEIVCDKGYMSTSRLKKWNWQPDPYSIHEGEMKFKFTVYLGKRGHLIRDFANRPQEEEVLVEAGTCFKVNSRKTVGDEERVELIELNEAGIPIGKN
ncbi:MAG: ADP-ribosyltransferase [Bdellovibrionota bacterium]